MQTKKHSVLEVYLNIFTGWLISLLIQIVFFPLYGWHITFFQSFHISLIFSAAAFIRGYLFRRYFNKIMPIQKTHHSMIEVGLNIFTGWVVAVILMNVVFPHFGIESKFHQQFSLSMIFTVAAVIRSFVFRRVFNAITKKRQQRLLDDIEDSAADAD